MLRTFCSNPALGGFGGDATTASAATAPEAPADAAFCQIIKELVDNAVDACTVDAAAVTANNSSNNKTQTRESSSFSTAATAKRVRVVIEPFQQQQHNTADEDDEDDTVSSRARNSSSQHEILRVTVSDNGCGMADIEKCVGAFHTSKAHNATSSTTATANTDKNINRSATGSGSDKTDASTAVTMEAQTAGRYGIGLTLCLLHAQRLVPNSCASIQSAVSTDKEWTVVAAVVDTAGDTVRCLPRDSLAKRGGDRESGTAISILVPGGPTATMAWPRLAEYFARFKLSLGITCSLEVLAPTLSRVPLWVRPATPHTETTTSKSNNNNKKKRAAKKKKKTSKKRVSPTSACNDIFDDDNWCDDPLESETQETSSADSEDEDEDDDKEDKATSRKRVSSVSVSTTDQGRLGIWKATQLFLGQPIDLKNVAHVIVPIRAKQKGRSKRSKAPGPKLEVDVIVHGPDDDDNEYAMDEDLRDPRTGSDDDDDDDDDALLDHGVTTRKMDEASSSASMVLVRMVNKIPLLDSAEAVACGLVQGLASKKRMWNSFGLDVGLKHDPANVGKLPTFEVRDSEQVAPFFKKGAHNLLEKSDDEEEFDTEDDLSSDDSEGGNGHRGVIKRKRQAKRRHLLPASVRLGNILVIAQIHAEPTTLPLPTLSKGRLPIDNAAIDDALEVGVTKCLQQLQKTNPNLLLTASELRKAERDVRYVPAVSLALASILTKSVSTPDPTIFERIRNWDSNRPVPAHIVTMSDGASSPLSNQDPQDSSLQQQQQQQHQARFHADDVETLGTLIEGRLRLVLSQPQTAKEKAKKKKVVNEMMEEEEDEEGEEEKNGDKSDVSSVDLGSVDIPWHLLDQDGGGDTGKKNKANTGARSNQLGSASPGGSGVSVSSPKADNSASGGEDYDDWL